MNVYKYYEPFNEEWEKELMKFTKKQLIQMYRKACIKNKELQTERIS